MKKLLALLLILASLMTVSVSSATAYEADAPCLLYGYDPDELDNYDTYGDQVFFKSNFRELTTPDGTLSITLNRRATENIIRASLESGSIEGIINESYFPEIEVDYIRSALFDPAEFSVMSDYYLEGTPGYKPLLSFRVVLKDRTHEGVHDALVALAPRADIDIETARYRCFSLNDVSNALKHIAGWEGYEISPADPTKTNPDVRWMDLNVSERVSLSEVAYVLKVIAGWRLEDFDPNYVKYK